MQADEDRGKQHRVWSVIERVLRPAGAALVAGLVAGAVASGAARVAMRLSALAADPCIGVLTENDNPCGVFTLGGTFSLIFFGAIFTGVPGAVLYAVFSPWLRPLGRWRGAVFGVLALAASGFVVFDSENVDFDRFGPPLLNVATFAVAYLVFGLVVAPVFDAVERRLPRLPPRRPIRPATLVGYGLMALSLVPILLVGVGSLGLGFVILAAVAVIHELGEAVARARERGTTPPILRTAYAIPLILVVAGSVVTASSVADILG